ncbi:MAG: hypothetical protein AAF360_12540 [Pseudomonadota bacterium]
MRMIPLLAAALAAILVAWLALDFASVGAWALEKQRWFQNEMASALIALRSGDAGAYLLLMSAAGAYGFVHAVGPGHGKYLIGGVGLGTSVSAGRLLSVSITSSLAQALWAILLVYGGFFVLEASARGVTALAEDFLAPASYVAIGAVGLVLALRGVRALLRNPRVRMLGRTAHQNECGCGSHHLPTDKLAGPMSLRAFAALVISIAVRPCTGAIFLLVIGWQLDIRTAAALAVIVMGLGTATLTSLVALSSVAARSAASASATMDGASRIAVDALQVLAGSAVMLISLGLLRVSMG